MQPAFMGQDYEISLAMIVRVSTQLGTEPSDRSLTCHGLLTGIGLKLFLIACIPK